MSESVWRLSLSAHALLGDEQDACCNDQDGANHIEDRGTDTTGAGKDGAGLVNDFTVDFTGC